VLSSLDCDLRSNPLFQAALRPPGSPPRRTSQGGEPIYRDDGTSFLRVLALLRLRIRARRFISTLRCSGVSFAQKALPAALAIFLRSDFGTPDQRLRPAARNLARGITITSLVFPIFVDFFTLTPAHLSGSEYATALVLTGSQVPIAGEPSTRSQRLEVGDTSQASEPFGTSAKFVRFHTDEDCSIKFGRDPEAIVTDARMSANSTEMFAVQGGHKVAAIGAGRGWPHNTES
jgi:hypothetical protein